MALSQLVFRLFLALTQWLSMLLQQPLRPVWAQVRFEHDEAHKSDEACGEYDDEKDEDVHMWQRKAKRLVPCAEQLSYRHRVTGAERWLNPALRAPQSERNP